MKIKLTTVPEVKEDKTFSIEDVLNLNTQKIFTCINDKFRPKRYFINNGMGAKKLTVITESTIANFVGLEHGNKDFWENEARFKLYDGVLNLKLEN